MNIAIRLNSKEDYFTLCKLFIEMKVENDVEWNKEYLEYWDIHEENFLHVYNDKFELHNHASGVSVIYNSVYEYLTTH